MYIGILGGSFNPLHMGHLRLALEALETVALPGHAATAVDDGGMAGAPPSAAPTRPQSLRLDRVDLVPSAQPPHKPSLGLLPFALRLELLRAAVRDIPELGVNDLEGHRHGPSYTWHTLEAYRRAWPGARLLFIVGGEDFATLPQWHRGLELPRLADVAMVLRADSAQTVFRHEVARNWPEARLVQSARSLHAELPWGARLLYLPLPRLDISASDIRQRWLTGRSVRFLMPDAVLDVLERHRALVTACWNENSFS